MAHSRSILTPVSGSEISDGNARDDCELRWQEAMDMCKKTLDETDVDRMFHFSSCEALLEHLKNLQEEYNGHEPPITGLVQNIEPHLRRYQAFVMALTHAVHSSFFKTTVIWGMISLVIECAKETKGIMNKIIEMIGELSNDMEIFEIYHKIFEKETRMRSALVDVFVDVIKWGIFCIKFLQNSEFENLGRAAWPKFSQPFNTTCKSVSKQLKHIKELAAAHSVAHTFRERERQEKQQQQSTAAEAMRTLAQLQLHSHDSQGTDPKVEDQPKDFRLLPYHKNKEFHGRTDVLKVVWENLDHDEERPSLQSLALWGTGGIGKTQIAIEYAREREGKGIRFIFWIHCESEAARNKSFAQVALGLKLKGAAVGNYDKNRSLVITWLQEATDKWLIIFDNVELGDDNDASRGVRDYWPVGNYGSILVTSRHLTVWPGPATTNLEVLVFTDGDGGQFLRNAVQRSNYKEDEVGASRELSRLLGGLPLALYIMAIHISRKGMSFQQFVKFYEENHKKLHKKSKHQGLNIYYEYSLDTCWNITFDNLERESRDASNLLASFCFVAPEDIPENLFSRQRNRELPDMLKFCDDTWDFQEVMDSLLGMSLIRKNPGADIYIHRILQTEYRERLGPSKRYECFLALASLLLEAFPRQIEGEPLRKEWSVCSRFVQHVIALVERYREYQFQLAKEGDFLEFTELLTNCVWYLVEVGSWTQCMVMIQVGLITCEDKRSLWYAHLCASAACVEAERAHTAAAHPYFEESIRIREKLLPADHQELANIYSSKANMLLTEQKPGAPAEAIGLYEKAIKIDKLKPAGNQLYGHLFIRNINLGFALGCQEKFEEAMEKMELARDYAIRRFGQGCHWEADCDYNEGFLYYEQGKWEDARRMYDRCVKIYEEENHIHPATSATYFKLACVDLRQGKIEKAIESLRAVLLMCQINEPIKGDKGETARAMRRLAEALEENQEYGEASRLKSEAETIRQELQGERYKDLPDCERSYNMMVCMNFW